MPQDKFVAWFFSNDSMAAQQDVPSIAKVSAWNKDKVKDTTDSYLKQYQNRYAGSPDCVCHRMMIIRDDLHEISPRLSIHHLLGSIPLRSRRTPDHPAARQRL